jgi:ribonuclease D
MFVPSISKDELHKLPVGQFTGQIHLIEDIAGINHVCKNLAKQTILGFDTETKPSFKKGNSNRVSLLQLATSNEAYLFRLHKTGIPEVLINILSDPAILKIGIAIHDDIRHLLTLSNFKPEGFVELQHFVKEYGIENSGLSKLAGIILNFRISKSQQLSNWENEILTEAQKTYAATDAWAACEIYKTLNTVPKPDLTNNDKNNTEIR